MNQQNSLQYVRIPNEALCKKKKKKKKNLKCEATLENVPAGVWAPCLAIFLLWPGMFS